ncbi:MAG: ASKHA domain-containing protein [Firmicutes bacterium]|nr:ASKHA domain-containing protein [Bacillota bacterium]
MARVTINGRTAEAESGSLLSELILPQNEFDMPCAGRGRCGKCRVKASGALSELSDAERRHLSADEIRSGIRLACCTRVEGDCSVTLERAQASQICSSGEMPDFSLNPVFSQCGAAVDIGTTTLSARLYRTDGALLAESCAKNPQGHWGADVISRIEAALHGELTALSESIRRAVDRLLEEMIRQAGIAADAVDRLVITGNTAMLYLFCGISPDDLSCAPFEAHHLFGELFPAQRFGLSCAAAKVYLPRCMSAFVGADITTALLASDICSHEATRLLIDIGTNGEAALWHKGKLLCCSTAAGPAFEGAGLSMGMLGMVGAVDHAALQNGQIRAHVIGEAEPRGICGSGVIDALACFLEQGILDESGLLDDDPTPVAGSVSMTQKDVRMIQLAKSAICAGLRTMMQLSGVDSGDVAELAVAGGFGSYIDLANAGRIGLIPPELVPRARVLGNAALNGASMLLLNRSFLPVSERLAAAAETVNLSTSPEFLEEYTNGMFFDSAEE